MSRPIEIKNLGSGDNTTYTKVDFAKVCRVGESFALSCYQMDYQEVANALDQTTQAGQLKAVKTDPVTIRPLVVGKLVMDREAFLRLRTEVNEIFRLAFPGEK